MDGTGNQILTIHLHKEHVNIWNHWMLPILLTISDINSSINSYHVSKASHYQVTDTNHIWHILTLAIIGVYQLSELQQRELYPDRFLYKCQLCLDYNDHLYFCASLSLSYQYKSNWCIYILHPQFNISRENTRITGIT